MFNIQTLNKISPIGLDHLDRALYSWGDEVADPAAILVRSAAMHDMELPESLLSIARAGAGVNNIPLEKCAEQGIVVFNTPGANANAVKELVIFGMLLSSRKIYPAMNWVQTLKGQGAEVNKLVEKGKANFVGPEITGKKVGIIGLGAIGILVANAAAALGMTVYGYDPYLSVDAAWGLSKEIIHAKTLKEIYENCDYITIHVPYNKETKEMINASSMATMKNGVRILNFARGELVNSADMLEALESKKVEVYVTDFPSDELLDHPGVLALPHLGASTPESEDNCAEMAVKQTMDYLENGNIVNSVNMPNVSMPKSGAKRICVIHKNVGGTISAASTAIAECGLNIEGMVNGSRGDYAYSIFDVDKDAADVKAAVEKCEGIIRVRVI